MFTKLLPFYVLLWCFATGTIGYTQASSSQESPSQESPSQGTVANDSNESTTTIVLQTAKSPPPPFLFSASVVSQAKINSRFVQQSMKLELRSVQGKWGTVSLGLSGVGDVSNVIGGGIASWAVRVSGEERFLDLQIETETKEVFAEVTTVSSVNRIPDTVDLLNLTTGKALGFESRMKIEYDPSVTGKVLAADGFYWLADSERFLELQSTKGGRITVQVDRSSTLPPPIELIQCTVAGLYQPDDESLLLTLRGEARVNQAQTKLRVLSGNVGLSKLPISDKFSLELVPTEAGPSFDLSFSETGTFPIEVEFAAKPHRLDANRREIHFQVAGGAVVPLTLAGFPKDIAFATDASLVVPELVGDSWKGFLPASGEAKMSWLPKQERSERKTFFSTSSTIEATVGAGLIRQNHRFAVEILQGELKSLQFALVGTGEITSVDCEHIVGWKITKNADQRLLELTLNQAFTTKHEIVVRSQTSLDSLPVRVDALCVKPLGAIRNAGFLRVSNAGSIKFEATDLKGLTQLAADQFPGDAIQARQSFAYRFPTSDYSFVIAADRVQPEISVSHMAIYSVTETDRILSAEIELDIREAAIREWSFLIPDNYTIASVSGASVSDYTASSEAMDGKRNLKVLFSQDVVGRQLLSIRLEKSEAQILGEWQLPRIDFPEAKTVRGDVGIVASAGFRTTAKTSAMLVEKPLAYFPVSIPLLQQAFRIREPNWSATLMVEQLDRSLNADVFHLYSLSQGTVYGSSLINFMVSGSPVSEWKIRVPETLQNLTVDGKDIRNWRRDGDTVVVLLHQPILGAYTLLITFEEKPNPVDGTFVAGVVTPEGTQNDRGFIEIVSPIQVNVQPVAASSQLLALDALELPAEFRLLSSAPSLGTWQYTARPFDLRLKINWFTPGNTLDQIVEFSEAASRVSSDGETVTDIVYFVKSRGQSSLRLQLPSDPVRLWSVSINGKPVSARQTKSETLVPLPGDADPNVPLEVAIRLGKPTEDKNRATISLPKVMAPVLKTSWTITGEENQTLLPKAHELSQSNSYRQLDGFRWVIRKGIVPFFVIGVLVLVGVALPISNLGVHFLKVLTLAGAFAFSAWASQVAYTEIKWNEPLQVNVPILATGESLSMEVDIIPIWRSWFDLLGLGVAALGLFLMIVALANSSCGRGASTLARYSKSAGFILLGVGALMQPHGAVWFFGILGLFVLVCLIVPALLTLMSSKPSMNRSEESDDSSETGPLQGVTSTLLVFIVGGSLLGWSFFLGINGTAMGQDPSIEVRGPQKNADYSSQSWVIKKGDAKLTATATLTVTGVPGDQFALLSSPAVLTEFSGQGLRLGKQLSADGGVDYVVTIATEPNIAEETADQEERPAKSNRSPKQYSATFQFELSGLQPSSGIEVLTGPAAMRELTLQHDEPSWEVYSEASARMTKERISDVDVFKLLLKPGTATVILRPKARDLKSETTQFFVEGNGVYTLSPGVIDGISRFQVRVAQGRLPRLVLSIPAGCTVSAVDGPITAWQFNADDRKLVVNIEPNAPADFSITVQTQQSLASLPTSVQLSPLRVEEADGTSGLLAIAFGSDAQPESVTEQNLSPVNLGDFDNTLLSNTSASLHRVYRYGESLGDLQIKVAAVSPEVRVNTTQVMSLGDERVVLNANWQVEIARTGIFQLGFLLPSGYEVETLTGESMNHWSEIASEGGRQVIMHLKAKTLGTHTFTLSLTGPSPIDQNKWDIPRLVLNDAIRQSGTLVIQPSPGIRLRTLSKNNVSELDARAMGAQIQGSLAFRLLQRDWQLSVGIEKLSSWVVGQILQDTTIREGQTRSIISAQLNVQNAPIKSMRVKLPVVGDEESRTVRASGEAISEIVRVESDEQVWEISFKRRVIGAVSFRIDFERRGERVENSELLSPASFFEVQQLDYHVAVRAGGRLEIAIADLPQGWQTTDWNSVAGSLRDAADASLPTLTLKVVDSTTPLSLSIVRHSLADSLKLRVASGTLTTIYSPNGDQLTSVDITMQVIQRSSLIVQLPPDSELFNIFVNGESVHSVRQSAAQNTWQFYILPGMDDTTARVRYAYALRGDGLRRVKLESPQMNVPLENIEWNIIVPQGIELADHDGNLELIGEEYRTDYTRDSYLKEVSGNRQDQAQQAATLLEQANQLLQTGNQAKAGWAFNNLANSYGLDAASNEDALVQLENLQTQQAILGLNSRRQRLLLDTNQAASQMATSEQFLQAAANNPVLKRNDTNFNPNDFGLLLAGNSQEDNATLQSIADRLVQHQRSTNPAPRAILISLPEEGNVYRFTRSVQVTQGSPLALELNFRTLDRFRPWEWLILGLGLVMIGSWFLVGSRKKR